MTTDPLMHGPEAERELFRRFSQLANGFPNEAAIGAAANILVNAIRQNKASRNQAEAAFDELFGKLKAVLLAHYDGAGKRRNVFPHKQTIHMPLLDLRKKGP